MILGKRNVKFKSHGEGMVRQGDRTMIDSRVNSVSCHCLVQSQSPRFWSQIAVSLGIERVADSQL